MLCIKKAVRARPVVLDFETGNIASPAEDIGSEELQIVHQFLAARKFPVASELPRQRPTGNGKRLLEASNQGRLQTRPKAITSTAADRCHVLAASGTNTSAQENRPTSSRGESSSQNPGVTAPNVVRACAQTAGGSGSDGIPLPPSATDQFQQEIVG